MKLILAIALLAFMGCVSNKHVADVSTSQAKETSLENKCDVIVSSEEWFKELMKIAAKNIYPATEEESVCPCYETITCEEEVYCSAHRCFDGSIRNPWEIEKN